MVPWQRHVPWYWVVMLKVTSLGPSLSFRLAYQDASKHFGFKVNRQISQTRDSAGKKSMPELHLSQYKPKQYGKHYKVFFYILYSNTYIACCWITRYYQVSYYLLRREAEWLPVGKTRGGASGLHALSERCCCLWGRSHRVQFLGVVFAGALFQSVNEGMQSDSQYP